MITPELKEAIRKRDQTLSFGQSFETTIAVVDDLIDSGLLYLPEDLENLRLYYEERAEELETIESLQKEIRDLETITEEQPDYNDGYADGFKAGFNAGYRMVRTDEQKKQKKSCKNPTENRQST